MLTARMADFITSLKYEDLPREVQNMAVLCCLDWVGSALRGSLEPPARMVEKVLSAEGGVADSTLVGFRKRGPSLGAALLNGVSAHTVEMDDLHRASILHPAAPIISAALAAAERKGVSGKAFLEGVVAGYEIGIRIGEAAAPAHYYYWHTTGTCGTFGAAAASAKILGLSAEQIIDALGSAGTQAAGLWEFHSDGAMSKHLHAGKAASSGLLSSYLAAEGFSAATRILEGEKGFFAATASSYDPGLVTTSLGEEYKILENSFKLYPSCRHTHGGVDLLLALHREGVEPRDVQELRYKTYATAVDLVGSRTPQTPFQAQFSLPYCGAAALVFGKLGLEEFQAACLQDPQVQKLLPLSRVDLCARAENAYPRRWVTVLECRLRDGSVLRKETEHPRGDPENPASAAELEEKYLELASSNISRREAEILLGKIKNLPALRGMRELF